MRRGAVLTLLTAALVAGGGAHAGPPRAVLTLHGQIDAFGAADGALAWARGGEYTCDMWVKQPSAPVRMIGRREGACGLPNAGPLAFDGRRVLLRRDYLQLYTDAAALDYVHSVFAGGEPARDVGRGREEARTTDQTLHQPPVAASAGRLAFVAECAAPAQIGDPCPGTRPGVYTVPERGGARPATRLIPGWFDALALSRTAIVTGAGSSIRIYSPSGRERHRLRMRSPVTAVATAERLGVALTGTDLVFFDLLTGTRRATVATGAAVTSLRLTGSRAVYSVGRSIRLADSRTRTTRVLVRTAEPPLGLSVSGDGVVWAESSYARTLVRFLKLPAARARS